MTKLFRSNTDALSDWLVALFGESHGRNYYLTTNHLKADEVPDIMQDAKTSTEFVAGLLNAYFNQVNIVDYTRDEILAMGCIDDLQSNDPNQTEINF